MKLKYLIDFRSNIFRILKPILNIFKIYNFCSILIFFSLSFFSLRFNFFSQKIFFREYQKKLHDAHFSHELRQKFYLLGNTLNCRRVLL